MWSEVFAHDAFAEVKKNGLLNKETGKKLKETIFSKGGSANPFKLLQDFLGREPNQEAFLEYLGFNE